MDTCNSCGATFDVSRAQAHVGRMAAGPRTCTSCQTPVPDGAGYCPLCGEATPTEISTDPGVPRVAPIDADEAEYRERLQRALGEGYQLREVIGRGGFGSVYTAFDVKLEREVAVKALRHDLFPTVQLFERFKREAKTVAKLQHPHVLQIHFVGEGEGIAFMVMPKVEGESLRAYLNRERQLSLDDALRIASEAAGALQAAHDAGIVHRDIKPENVLLEGRERRVLIMDFGIAKSVEVPETQLTATGLSIGTPLYMSPEQAGGEQVDGRSDVYSLACVLYEMLVGEPPFTGATAQAIIARHLTDTPSPIRTVRAEVPVELESTVLKGLAKTPADRFESAATFAEAMRSGTAQEPAPSTVGASSRPPLIHTPDMADVRTYDLKVDAVMAKAVRERRPITVRVSRLMQRPGMGWAVAIALLVVGGGAGGYWYLMPQFGARSDAVMATGDTHQMPASVRQSPVSRDTVVTSLDVTDPVEMPMLDSAAVENELDALFNDIQDIAKRPAARERARALYDAPRLTRLPLWAGHTKLNIEATRRASGTSWPRDWIRQRRPIREW